MRSRIFHRPHGRRPAGSGVTRGANFTPRRPAARARPSANVGPRSKNPRRIFSRARARDGRMRSRSEKSRTPNARVAPRLSPLRSRAYPRIVTRVARPPSRTKHDRGTTVSFFCGARCRGLFTDLNRDSGLLGRRLGQPPARRYFFSQLFTILRLRESSSRLAELLCPRSRIVSTTREREVAWNVPAAPKHRSGSASPGRARGIRGYSSAAIYRY